MKMYGGHFLTVFGLLFFHVAFKYVNLKVALETAFLEESELQFDQRHTNLPSKLDWRSVNLDMPKMTPVSFKSTKPEIRP